MPCTRHPEVQDGVAACRRCEAPFCRDCAVEIQGVLLCAPCKDEQVRDLLSGRTPGALPLASILRRFLAYWIDGFVTTGLTYAGACLVAIPVALALGVLSQALGAPEELMGFVVQIAMLPFAFLAPFVYEGWMLKARGQTLGKMALGVTVLTPQGAKISPGQAWGRAAVKAGFHMCCGLADLLPALFTEERTTLHDLVAQTRAVGPRGASGICCPRCGAAAAGGRLAAGPQVCARCRGSFDAVVFSPASRLTHVAAVGESPEATTPCVTHPRNAAVGHCERCGIFLCALCRVEAGRRPLCPTCFERLSAEGGLDVVRRGFTDLGAVALVLALVGSVVPFLGLALGPAVLYFSYGALRQRQALAGTGPRGAIYAAMVLGVLQAVAGVALVALLVRR